MEKDNKGFTLVELLAVIVILMIISVIAISSISAAIERNKVKQDNAKKDIIVSYAKLYYDEHKNSFNENTGYICLNRLNLSDTEITNSDNEMFTGAVQYTKELNGTVSFAYVDDAGSCS